jgi:hypothetical protein
MRKLFFCPSCLDSFYSTQGTPPCPSCGVLQSREASASENRVVAGGMSAAGLGREITDTLERLIGPQPGRTAPQPGPASPREAFAAVPSERRSAR